LDPSVTETNDAPTTSVITLADTAGVIDVYEDVAYTFDLSDADTQAYLLQNAVDADGDQLTVNSLSLSKDTSGVLENNGDSIYTYTPALNNDTSGTILYTISDGTVEIEGSVAIDILAKNDAPTFSNLELSSVSEKAGAFTLTAAELLVNVTDVEGDNVSIEGVSSNDPSKLSVQDNGNGTWTFTPLSADFNDSPVVINIAVVDDGTSDIISDSDELLIGESSPAYATVTASIDLTSTSFDLESGLVRVSDVGGSVQYLDLTESGSTQTAASQNILLNLSNLNSFVSVQGGYIVENTSAFDSSLILPIDDLPDGNGSGSITLTVLDGDNFLRSSAERKLELSIDLEWSDGVVTAPEQTIQGYVINDTINADPKTEGNEFTFSFEIGGGAVSVTEDGSVAINLAQVFSYVSTLKDVDSGKAIFDMTGSASNYSLSISTSDVPLLRADTDSQITNFETGLSIIDGLAINNADAEVFTADEIVIAGDDGADEISGQSGVTEFLLGLGGADVFIQDLSGGVANSAEVDVVADFVIDTDKLKLTDGESAIAFADLQIVDTSEGALLSLSEGGNSLHLLLLEDINAADLVADDFI
jgi:hypothetical protein